MLPCVVRFYGHRIALWAILFSLAAARVHAVDMFWSNSRGDGSGTFSQADNWTSSNPFISPPPDNNDEVYFGMTTSNTTPRTYTVAFTGNATNEQLFVEDDRVTFDLNGHTYSATDAAVAVTLGTVAGFSGRLTVTDGIVTLPLRTDVNVGSVAGGSGVLIVTTGGQVLGSPELFVGASGGGTLNVTNGGDVIADSTTLGLNGGVSGTATITGASSSLLADQLVVGSNGTGVLNVNAGGRVDSASGVVGDLTGSTGTANVDGVNSQWNLSGSLNVGRGGSGTLNITGGGRVNSTIGRIAIESGSTGAATIDGPGSLWSLSDALVVGSVSASARGALDVSAGAAAESASGSITAGDVTVRGSGAATPSRWVMPGTLNVGFHDPSTLAITEGGLVQNGQGIIDNGSAVTVSNAQWINANALTVGKQFGENALHILAGGVVHSAGALVSSENASSQGAVTISGTSSRWINTGSLNVGRSTFVGATDGTLDLNNGGRLTNSGNLLVFGTLSITTGAVVETANGAIHRGAALVQGPGSRWINSGDLTVGFDNTTLDITDGGLVQDRNGIIGFTSGGLYTVNVSGAGSQWTNSGQLTLGTGPSRLNIIAGGLVENTDAIVRPIQGPTPNRVSVSGTNSRWVNSGDLMLGVGATLGSDGGNANLSITAGGRVQNDNAVVGENGSGTVTVSGVNSRWINSGQLHVGRGVVKGGAMNILAGGFVQNTAGFVGGTASATGDIVVSGADSRGATSAVAVSQWINSGELTIGQFGAATLSIEVGGVVSSATSYIAKLATGHDATATVGGAGAQWAINGRLFIGGREDGNGGNGTLRIRSGGQVAVAQDTRLFASDLLQLEGHTLSTTEISFNGGGTFAWTSGTLHVGLYHQTLTVPNSGTLAPGNSVGRTDIDGHYSQAAGGTLEIEIGGPASADLVAITGVADLSGNLQLKLLNGFSPAAASSFVVFDSRGINGAFLNAANGQRLTTTDGLGSFVINYGASSPFNPNQIVLSNFLATALPGDYNQNGTVDAADYTVWRNKLGSGTSLPNDDTPGVGQDDYTRWRTHFGQATGTGSLANTAVPEPTSAALLGLLMFGWSSLHRTPRVCHRPRHAAPLPQPQVPHR